MRNKKAMISTPLVDFWSIVAFILVILLFHFIINDSIDNGSATMLIRANEISANAMLESYLNTPVSVDGKEIQMSQLIINSYAKKEYTSLEKPTVDILKHTSDWVIGIDFPLESGYGCIEFSDAGGTHPVGSTVTSPGTCVISLGAAHGPALANFVLPTPDYKSIKIEIYQKLK